MLEALVAMVRPQELAAAWAGAQAMKAADPTNVQAALAWLADHPLDMQALRSLLATLEEDAWLAGVHVGAEMLAGHLAADASDLTAEVDWARWKPGDPTVARHLLEEGSGRSLRELLDAADVTIDGIAGTTMDRLAEALAHSIEGGLGVDETGRLLRDVIDDPERADLIATTETARAMTAGAIDSYRENGVEMFDVLVADPCEVCADEAAANPHPLSDDAPPFHPACRCAAAPVVESGAALLDEGE